MQNKSWFSILFNLAILIILGWGILDSLHMMDAAEEEIEVIRHGFTALICMGGFIGIAIMQRMEQLLNK